MIEKLYALGEYANEAYRMDLAVNSDYSYLPDNSTGRRFHESLEKLRFITLPHPHPNHPPRL